MIKLLSGDCREVLATLPADSVHCVVTSPPYFALRSYLHAEHPDKHREIGSEPTPDEYLATMVAVFREVRRVLRPDGTCWVNIGDSYASGQNGSRGNPERSTLTGGGGRYREGSKVEAMFNEQAPTKRASNGAGVKPKDLLMMPARLALALQADGWWVRSEITWCKPSPMPESCTDRPTSATEKVYLLTKRANYFYDAIAIREAAVSDHPSGNGYKRNPRLSYSDDHGARGNDEPWEGVGGTRNARNWWVINSKPFPQAHFATYPPELAERCIRAGTSERGCCAQCGKPWVRVTERNLDNVPTRLATKRAPVDCEAMAAYLRERREALGLSRVAVDEALGTRTLYSWFEGRPAAIEPPTPEQWTKLKEVLALDDRFDEQIYGTVEVVITDHSPSKAAGVRTYAKAWNSETMTTGWQPGCKCGSVPQDRMPDERQEPRGRDSPQGVDRRVGAAGGAATPAQPIPCTVLDPFAGAGTTLLVADRLQRDAIGIELNVAYTQMAMDRVRADAPLFADLGPVPEHPEETQIADLFREAAD